MVRDMSQLAYVKYILFRPVEGFEELRFNKKGSVTIAFSILVILFITKIFENTLTDFIFYGGNKDEYNVLYQVFEVFGIFALFTLANWSVCTLLDGEGRMKDIIVAVAYAMVPYIITSLLWTLFSYALTIDEAVFLTWLYYIGLGWTGWVLVMGMMVMHQYSLKKTLLSIVFTVLGMLFVVFLFILLFSLFNQIYTFLNTVYKELIYRF